MIPPDGAAQRGANAPHGSRGKESTMLCRDIMKTDVKCVAPTDPVTVAARRMRDENIGFLPVCEDDGTVRGTLTDRDITIRVIAAERPVSSQVKEIMTPEVVACKETDDVSKAQELLRHYQKSRIMCLDIDNHLVGVISLSDLAETTEQEAAETLRAVSARESHIRHPGPS
jgi:CBS domain-containing protein